MATITAEEARSKFSDVVNRAAYGNERTIITKHGKSMAAIVSMEDLEILERIIAKLEDEMDVQSAKAAIKEAETEGTIPWESIKAELGL